MEAPPTTNPSHSPPRPYRNEDNAWLNSALSGHHLRRPRYRIGTCSRSAACDPSCHQRGGRERQRHTKPCGRSTARHGRLRVSGTRRPSSSSPCSTPGTTERIFQGQRPEGWWDCSRDPSSLCVSDARSGSSGKRLDRWGDAGEAGSRRRRAQCRICGHRRAPCDVGVGEENVPGPRNGHVLLLRGHYREEARARAARTYTQTSWQ